MSVEGATPWKEPSEGGGYCEEIGFPHSVGACNSLGCHVQSFQANMTEVIAALGENAFARATSGWHVWCGIDICVTCSLGSEVSDSCTAELFTCPWSRRHWQS